MDGNASRISINRTLKLLTMENGLIKQQLPTNEIMSIGKAFAESGLFPDIKQAAQAIVKIQAGQEMGIAPFAAMTGIHLIQGKPTVGAGIIASRIKASGKYNYKVKEMTEKNCSLDFYEGAEMIGNSSFSIEDAKKAETKNIGKFPRNMLFARAISNGQKWFCPDVFSCSVYTPEEMNQVTEDTQADISTVKTEPEKVNGHTPEITKDDVMSVVTDPSDIDQENKEVIPGHWYAKLEKCMTPEDVDILGVAHKETVNANPELRKLFVQRKTELKKPHSQVLPF